jgi:3-methylfumaryl-CoA hydratase
MSENLADWIGTSQTLHDTVSRAALSRFTATIDSAASPDSVPQGFHWCLCLPDAPTASLVIDGHPPKGGFLPPVNLPRRMWAASDIDFRAPLNPCATIERVSKVAGIAEKSGAAGPLTFVEVEHTTRANGVACIVERQTIVYRQAAKAPMPMPPCAEPDLSAWPWRRSLTPDAALLFRYSALTFNAHRIHYDLPYAREQECYPGLVVHGPLMATLLLDLCARALGPDCLAHFSFRVVAPAFAGQPLHLVGRPGKTIELQALGADGRIVVSATGKQAKGLLA